MRHVVQSATHTGFQANKCESIFNSFSEIRTKNQPSLDMLACVSKHSRNDTVRKVHSATPDAKNRQNKNKKQKNKEQKRQENVINFQFPNNATEQF